MNNCFDGIPIHYAETKYGFEWGAAKMERCFSDHKKGWVTFLLKTPKHPHGIQIYVTKTGKVRIHSENSEWMNPAPRYKTTKKGK